MSGYRWDLNEAATGYDEAADTIHPYYTAIQDLILSELAGITEEKALIVDAGGGSGRLIERFLERSTHTRAIIVDQSEAFLALAERRLARFGDRVDCLCRRLQDDWASEFKNSASAIVSMSAVHHLDSGEKRCFYQQSFDVLACGGLLLNGDEVRPEDDEEYLAELKAWATHMRRIIADGLVPQRMHAVMGGWIERNVTQFGMDKVSGDDCHEPIATQLACLTECGFASTGVTWQAGLWAVMKAVKP